VHWRHHLRFPAEVVLSTDARDLIERLLCDVDQRLGTRNVQVGRLSLPRHRHVTTTASTQNWHVTATSLPHHCHVIATVDTPYASSLTRRFHVMPRHCHVMTRRSLAC